VDAVPGCVGGGVVVDGGGAHVWRVRK
jgi:hypothetical protein